MKVKSGGSWADVKSVNVKVGGVWSRSKEVWVKQNGVWVMGRQSVPSNMVVLYNSATYPGYLCNGSNGTPNLLNRFVKATATPLTTGGAATHSGTSHGTDAPTFTAANNIEDAAKTILFPNGYAIGTSTHTHTHGSTHSHSGDVTNANCFDKYKLIPTQGADYISANAVFFNKGSLSDAAWTAFAGYAARYLYLASTNGASLFATHAHSAGSTGDSTTYAVTPTMNYYLNPDTVTWYKSHKHLSKSHSLTAAGEYFLSDYRFYQYYYNSATPLYDISKLPINTVALFTTTTLPTGWVRVTASDNYFLNLSNNSSVGNIVADTAATHGHSSANVTSNALTSVATSSADNTQNTGSYTIKAHTHVMNDHHASNVNITPPWVSLVVAYKNF